MTILIPSYEPDGRLLKLIESIKSTFSCPVVIVNDGSGGKFEAIFDYARSLGSIVLNHPVNRGKGCALKTGFRYILESGEHEGVVCADSDGQHLPEDIMKVAQKVRESEKSIVLVCRRFAGKVPVRSRFGNSMTRMVFALTTGRRIYDTQTGLRGYPSDMLEWLLSVPGERFEYEMNILLEAEGAGYTLSETDINTVYFSGEKSSHFRTFADSYRVYLPLLKFSASSIISGILDFALLFIFQTFMPRLLFSVLGARLLSSIANYAMNRNFVFSYRNKTGVGKSLLKYYILVTVLLAVNYLVLSTLNLVAGIPLFFAKIITEIIVYVLSYRIQHRYVFRNRNGSMFQACAAGKTVKD
jgi:glycosyltransferase involved in cell wall biosynthesis